MSDQPENANPENANAETTQFEAVQPAPVAATQPAAAQQPVAGEDKASNRKVIMAAVGGAIAVAIIALAGVVGFAIGSHQSDDRGGFGGRGSGPSAQNFERHDDQMMDEYGQRGPGQDQGLTQNQQGQGPGSMMGPNQQGQGPGQLPQGMMNQQQTQ
jgi:hypothetical protein